MTARGEPDPHRPVLRLDGAMPLGEILQGRPVGVVASMLPRLCPQTRAVEATAVSLALGLPPILSAPADPGAVIRIRQSGREGTDRRKPLDRSDTITADHGYSD